jgi:aminopeptidase YwaD
MYLKRLLFLTLIFNREETYNLPFINSAFFMKPITRIFHLLLALVLVSCSNTGNKNVTTRELQNHIKYLSSDSLKGRLTGSTGDSLAADYIRSELASYGLVPLSGDGLERFKVTEKILAGKENSLSVNGIAYNPENDFTPVAFSENSYVKAEVIFAGYGFSINNDSLKWDDYKGTDIKNKWVMMLRSDPEPDNQNSKFAPFAADRNKAMSAKDLGAAGILIVSGKSFDNSDTFDPLAKGGNSVGIPVFRIKRTVADAILKKSKHTIDDLEKNLNSGKKPFSFSTGVIVEARSEILNYLTNTRNVMMLLPGEDENLKNEYLIFGAHFDHLGMGGPGSGSRAVDTIGVHPGADDNASGVAMLIEVAGKFAGTKNSHKRSLIFVAFTGEEEGLLGSKYFTDNPLIDLSKADAMINLDMVGRLKETKDLQIAGVGTADSLKERAVSVADTNKLRVTFTEEGSGPSDHSAFYSKNIPVLYFTTGAHDEYHKPSDTWDKINYPGMVNVADLIFKITAGIANEPAKLKFKEAGQKEDPNRPPRRRGITLGIMPDVTGSIKNGLKVEAVTPGRPGAIGGMKKGDIIVSVNEKAVNNIEDYMFRLGQLKKGQTISVEVLRNNKKEVLIIKL